MFERSKFHEHHTGPALSEAMLAQFERRHGIRFPESLRIGLLKLNGGDFARSQFKINGRIEECGHFYPIMENKKKPWQTFESMQAVMERSGEYKQMSELLGNLSKVFLFCEHDGYWHFALNFNDKPASVWCIFLDSDGSGKAEEAAPSWDEFLALQYDGDEKPSVEFGAGWSQYKILFKGELKGEVGTERKILGLRANTLRFQQETRAGEESTFREFEGDVTQARAAVGFDKDGVIVRVEGDGKVSGKKCSRNEGKWINTEDVSALDCSVKYDSLEDALLLFAEIDRLSIRHGLRARRHP